jgi:centrosomal protein CEP164
MSLTDDADLLWIAREGLKAPLPKDWKPCQTPEGEIYYFNFGTGDSTWEHPCDEYYKKMFADEKRKKTERANDPTDSAKGGAYWRQH